MSAPSKWPLPAEGVRFLTPAFMRERLANHPLTTECYPTAMGFYPRASGHRMQRDEHDDNLLIYCANGRGHLETDGWAGPVGTGDVAMLPRGAQHLYEANAKKPWTLYWVHFDGGASSDFFSYLGFERSSPVVFAGLSPDLRGAFTTLLEVRRTGYSVLAFVKAANQLRHLLSLLALEFNAQRGKVQRGLDVSRVQTYMLANIGRSLSLDQLAACAGMSKYHFSKRYKELTGYSPVKHLLNMKMEQACALLDGTHLSVGEIAFRLGYDDPLYFSRLFKKVIGRSPRAYRASIR